MLLEEVVNRYAVEYFSSGAVDMEVNLRCLDVGKLFLEILCCNSLTGPEILSDDFIDPDFRLLSFV